MRGYQLGQAGVRVSSLLLLLAAVVLAFPCTGAPGLAEAGSQDAAREATVATSGVVGGPITDEVPVTTVATGVVGHPVTGGGLGLSATRDGHGNSLVTNIFADEDIRQLRDIAAQTGER